MTEEMPNSKDRPIVERLPDPDETVRLAALGEVLSLSRIPQALIPHLADRLFDQEEDCCVLAILALGKVGAPGVPHLVQALSPARPAATRAFAAGTLAGMECDRAAAIPELCRGVLDPDQALREQSALALARIGAAAVPALCTALIQTTGNARISVMQALGQIGPDAKDALPYLKQAAAGQPAEFLVELTCAVMKILQNGKAGMNFLLSTAAAVPALRASILEKIGSMGSIANESWASILPYLRDPSPEVRAVTAIALARMWMDHAEQVPAGILDSFIQALEDSDPKVRANAGIALSAFGPCAERAIPALERHVADPEEQVAAVARAAIDKISPR
jgi:HEAT repeat protein